MTVAARGSADSVGQGIEGVEDERLITGQGAYIADISRPGQLHARIVRSPIAHGRLTKVHLEDARAMAGVVAVFAGGDVSGLDAWRIPHRVAFGLAMEDLPLFPLQPILAIDRVRYVGEPLAVVVAEDPYVAEDAAALVWTEIEDLEPVLNLEEALTSDNLLFPDAHSNVLIDVPFGDAEATDALFAEADVVVSERLSIHRHAATPMENRGLIAELGEDGRLSVWGPTKVKHFNLRAVANVLGLPEEDLRFIEPDVGGSFGARGELYPEDFLIPWLALHLKRPIKWIEDRAEGLVASNQSREQYVDLEVAASADGELLALRSHNVCSMGAYFRTNGAVPPVLCAYIIAGPYAWRAHSARGTGVATNKTPLGTFRGPGEVEATYARERLLDIVARRLDLDPVDLRRRNLVDSPRPVAGTVESGDCRTQFDGLLQHVDYPALRSSVSTRSADELVGVGVACSEAATAEGHFESAQVVAERDGTFTAHTGLASVGQGVRTAMGQVLADLLQVPFDRVAVTHHDTDVVPVGEGAFGDRGAVFGAGAISLAVEDLESKARAATGDRFGVEPETVVIESGRARAGGRSIPLWELGVSGVGRFERSIPHDTNFVAAIAVVSVDRRTGKVTPLRYVGAYDVGRVINPLLLEGQLTGAAAQGITGALLEENVYDEIGQPLSSSFMDYLIATCKEMPAIESLMFSFPKESNPLGIKGGGNSGIICTQAALANAVADALGEAGDLVTSLPLRANRVRELFRVGGLG